MVGKNLLRGCAKKLRFREPRTREEGGRQSARRLTLVAKRLASTLAELAPQTIILIDANQGGATVAEFLEDFPPSSHYPSINLALSGDNSET